MLTHLNNDIMDSLVDKLSQVVKYPRVDCSDFNLCFIVKGEEEVELPEMTFGFSGAAVRVPARNMFVRVEEGVVYFLGVVGSDYGIQVSGNLAQQNCTNILGIYKILIV